MIPNGATRVSGPDESLNERRLIAQETMESRGMNLGEDRLRLWFPQPSTDPLDPLNWTSLKKHVILGIVMWMYFMFTYITTTTVPSFSQLQELYNINYSQVSWTIAIPSIGLSLGPLFWSPMADIYGRRLVFLVGTIIALVATIGTAVSKTYGIYMAARFFQGFGVSPGGTVGMAIIGDLFFDYERGQKLGLWVLAINSGLLVGPIVGGLMDIVGPIWIDWLTAILFGHLLVLELVFLPETLYPRNSSLRMMSPTQIAPGTQCIARTQLKRTTDLSFINLAPVPGVRHPKPWNSLIRFGLMFKYPVVALPVVIFCFTWYWWVLSIVTLIPAAYSRHSPSAQGSLFLGLLLGTWFAELFCSGRLGDWLVQRLSKKNGGVRVPEMRLWLAYPAALLSAIGLILWGASVDNEYHWMVGQVAFFLFAIGLQTGNTVISTYVIDCYPLQSTSVVLFYSVVLDLSAFINPFFITAWVESYGYTTTFAVQGIIIICVTMPGILLVHKFGARIRDITGAPGWVNPEHDTL